MRKENRVVPLQTIQQGGKRRSQSDASQVVHAQTQGRSQRQRRVAFLQKAGLSLKKAGENILSDERRKAFRPRWIDGERIERRDEQFVHRFFGQTAACALRIPPGLCSEQRHQIFAKRVALPV